MTDMKKKSIFSGDTPKENIPEVKYEKKENRPFTKENFWMMGACVVLIIVGFLLMSGGRSNLDSEFNPEIFSTRRIVTGPLLAFLGFLFMAFAIIWSPAKRRRNKEKGDKPDGLD